MALAPTASIHSRQKRVTFQNPGPATKDNDGGFTQSWTDLPPAASAHIAPATTETLERLAAGSTVLSSATHIVTVPYRAGISTQTRILVDGRTLNVKSIVDKDERHVELALVCEEVVT